MVMLILLSMYVSGLKSQFLLRWAVNSGESWSWHLCSHLKICSSDNVLLLKLPTSGYL